jgi:hypothetical protein
VQGGYVLVYSRSLLVGLLEKLELPRIKEKYSITDDDITDLIALFVLPSDLVIPERQVTICHDPEDTC